MVRVVVGVVITRLVFCKRVILIFSERDKEELSAKVKVENVRPRK